MGRGGWGGPCALFVVRMEMVAAMRAILDGSIEVIPSLQTLKFHKVINVGNYPGLLLIRVHDYRKQMLAALRAGQELARISSRGAIC